jgi:hypothetical protein
MKKRFLLQIFQKEKWGKVMLTFAHGDHVKRDKFAKLIASEQPKMWGETVFREVHTGDKHQSRMHLRRVYPL